MQCIVSISGMEETISSCGLRSPKPMLLIGEKPLMSNLFEELQKMHEFFERIYIVGSDLKPYEDWMHFCLKDEFFKTKISFLKAADSSSIDTDVWSAVEWLASGDHILSEDLLIVRPDIFWTDLSFVSDEQKGSWRAYTDGRPLNVWKTEGFARTVNAMAYAEEHGKPTMEGFTEKAEADGWLGAVDAAPFLMPLKNPKDLLDAAKWRESQKSGGALDCEIDLKRQTVKMSNAWRTKKWTPAVHLVEREIQSLLWDCWDFLDSAGSWQRPYLPAPVSRGPNVRGQYCNWIELQWIPDSSVEAMMLNRALSESEWRSIVDKALDILEESFWLEQEKDWRSDADRKDRARYLEDRSVYWQNLIETSIQQFSRIKWETVLSRHLEWLEDHVKDRKSVFHNGTGGRMVHGGLSLRNILCNWQTLDIHFALPRNRTGILVDSLSEYAPMYADCWALLPVFIQGRHVDCGPEGLDVPDYIAENAASIEGILDERLGDQAREAKTEALMFALESIKDVPADHRKAFLAFLHYRADELYTGSSSTVRRRMADEAVNDERRYAECPKARKDFACLKEIRKLACQMNSGRTMHCPKP